MFNVPLFHSDAIQDPREDDLVPEDPQEDPFVHHHRLLGGIRQDEEACTDVFLLEDIPHHHHVDEKISLLQRGEHQAPRVAIRNHHEVVTHLLENQEVLAAKYLLLQFDVGTQYRQGNVKEAHLLMMIDQKKLIKPLLNVGEVQGHLYLRVKKREALRQSAEL